MGKALGRRPPSYFDGKLDLIIDNKRFAVPTTKRGREWLQKQAVHAHLRTPGARPPLGPSPPSRYLMVSLWWGALAAILLWSFS
jgi:hypothetical protein